VPEPLQEDEDQSERDHRTLPCKHSYGLHAALNNINLPVQFKHLKNQFVKMTSWTNTANALQDFANVLICGKW